MKVNENTEYYLINSMGLNKKQIKDMTPGEVEDHCKKIIKDRINKRGLLKTEKKSKKSKVRKTDDSVNSGDVIVYPDIF